MVRKDKLDEELVEAAKDKEVEDELERTIEISPEVAEQLKDLSKVNIQYSLQTALSRYQLLIDATNSANVIGEKEITPDTFIAAPGIPLGLTEAAYAKVKDRLLHDPLQTGVATMGVMALVF